MLKSQRGGKRKSVADVVTEVVTQSGDKADLTNFPLTYGGEDAALDGTNRQVIESFEDKYKTRKSEYGILVDKYGRVLQEQHGRTGSVSMSQFNYSRAEVMSHIHPRAKGDEGCLGGTFSYKDMVAFTKFPNLKTMRAAATEGVYSISKEANFDKNGFDSYVYRQSITRQSHYNTAEKAARKDYHDGKITYSEYRQRNVDAFNEYLVRLHDDFRAGQKQYGYTYQLERRKNP